jgi:hypothetical protein
MALYFEMYLKVDWVRLECELSDVNLMAKIASLCAPIAAINLGPSIYMLEA